MAKITTCSEPAPAHKPEAGAVPVAGDIPVYTSLAISMQNYTSNQIKEFRIADAFQHFAHGSDETAPGDGGARSRCCYTLKGARFHVTWYYKDSESMQSGKNARKSKTAEVEFTPTEGYDPAKPWSMALHVYPDDHVEIQFPTPIPSLPRIPIAAVWNWIFIKHPELRKNYKSDESWREDVAKAIGRAWMQYRIVDQGDLEQYAYRSLTSGQAFDSGRSMQETLKLAKDKPGTFKAFSESLSPKQLKALGES